MSYSLWDLRSLVPFNYIRIYKSQIYNQVLVEHSCYIKIITNGCNVLISQKKKRKEKKRSKSQIFNGPHVPHLTQQSPTTHFHTILFLSFGWPSLSSFHFLSYTHLYHSHPLHQYFIPPPPPPFPPSFSGKITRKFLGTHKHLHILFLR